MFEKRNSLAIGASPLAPARRFAEVRASGI
jgi:hypothetical protein